MGQGPRLGRPVTVGPHHRRFAVGELVLAGAGGVHMRKPLWYAPACRVEPSLVLEFLGHVALGAAGVIAKDGGSKPRASLLGPILNRLLLAGKLTRRGNGFLRVAVPGTGADVAVEIV